MRIFTTKNKAILEDRNKQSCRGHYTIYSLRGVSSDYEIDLVVEYRDISGNTILNLIECKRSTSKKSKHFSNIEVVAFKQNTKFNEVREYTLYCVGETKKVGSVCIEEFLSNLTTYLC